MVRSRQSTRQRAVQQRTRKRRQRQLWLLLIVGGAVVVVVLGLILLSQQSAVTVTDIGDYSAFPQGVEEDGAPFIGDANAPATMVEYSDFSCPHCANFSETVHQLIDTYVANGSLRIVYKPMSFVDPQGSPRAAAAGLCASEQRKFWEMHDALFGAFSTNGSRAFTDKNLVDLASQVELDVQAFEQCVGGPDSRRAVQTFQTEAQSLGINSTPTVTVNGTVMDPGALSFEQLEQLILSAAT